MYIVITVKETQTNKYDMSLNDMREIIDTTAEPEGEILGSQFYKAIRLGFQYGYIQGMKAATAGKPVENPKCKSEYQDAIRSNLKRIKEPGGLKLVYKLSQLLADLNGSDYELGRVIYLLLTGDFTAKNISCISSLLSGMKGKGLSQ